MSKLFKYFCVTPLFLIAINCSLISQSSISDSTIGMHQVRLGVDFQIPFADMADRFGNNFSVGAGYAYKFKNNIDVGLSYRFMFSNDVKDTGMLSELRTSLGIINSQGEFGTYGVVQRGHHLQIKSSYTLPVFSPNKNSGFYGGLGIGFIVHRVHFINTNSDIPQFNVNDRAYVPGYDRYTSGITISEEIGYRYFSNKSLINFFVGIEFIQGFNKIRRDYQVDYEPNFEKKLRKDNLLSFKFGWVLPIYKKPSKDYYY